jgi:hypothetical protein
LSLTTLLKPNEAATINIAAITAPIKRRSRGSDFRTRDGISGSGADVRR